MAKYLTDELELQSVANAIRAKGNTSESLAFPTDFVSAIADIPAGGNIEEDGNGNLTFSTDGNVIGKMPLAVSANGTYTPPAGKAYSVVEVNIGGNKPSKDVNFRDYDGTIVDSYTKEEFAELTEMPANPSHDGLTAQGWNWSLADAQTYVAKYGRLEVGQMYITDDGKTRVHIHLEEGRTSPMLGVCPDGTVDVDWGDGTAHDTLTGTSISTVQWTPNHTYAAPGDYVIKLTVTGRMAFRGAKASNQGSYLLRYSSSGDERNNYYRSAIRSVEFGSNVTIGAYVFSRCFALEYVTIPDNATSLGAYAFSYCYALKYATIPNSATSIDANAFESNYTLNGISLPNRSTIFNSNALFYSCYAFSNITIPQGVTYINADLFAYCYSLVSIIIPDSVMNIVTPFNSCYSLVELHFTSTTPPTITSSTFSSISADCIVYVPYSEDHSILNAYKTATNWSTYASYIQEEPV